ncbi:MAG: transcriptional regulator [Burkholderiales bacterium]|nr:transcriptional regulator [Burkholderiales bacterium]
MNFAVSKIQPPRLRRGTLVARPALAGRIADAMLQHRLVLLGAAAGYGKTAALSQALDHLADRVQAQAGPGAGTDASAPLARAWLSADGGDDLPRLLDCLLAALEPHDLPWRLSPEALRAMATTPAPEARRQAASTLVNALEACEARHGVIVIDDLHRIDDAAVHDFLDRVLERLGPRWCIAIASRTDPPLALARLRAVGALAEFRQADLQFTLDEARALAQAVGADAGTADTLLARTQGWAVGLRLALGPTPPPGSRPGAAPAPLLVDRHVFDFLASEVLDRQPPPMRRFLLRSAVLAELSPARAAELTGDADAAAWLDRIERDSLFATVLEPDGPTLRLHDLFRRFLLERLRRDHPDELPALWRRAAAGEPDLDRRIGLLLQAQAWGEAEALLDAQGLARLAEGRVDAVLRPLAQFPPGRVTASPRLSMLRCLAAWAHWDWPAMCDAARAAVAGFTREADPERTMLAQVYEAVALSGQGQTLGAQAALQRLPAATELSRTAHVLAEVVRSWHALEQGDLPGVGRHYGAAIAALQGCTDASLWYRCLPLSLNMLLPGMAAPLRAFVDGALLATEAQPSPLRAVALAVETWLATCRGDAPHALATLARAEADARWLGEPPNVRAFVGAAQAAAQAQAGHAAAARAGIERLLSVFDDAAPGTRPARTQRGSTTWGIHLFFALRVADALDDADTVQALAARLPPLPANDESLAALARTLRLTLPGRLAWHAGARQPAQARAAAEAFAAALVHEPALAAAGLDHELRWRLARAWLRGERPAEAAQALRPVLAALATPVGGAAAAGSVALPGPATLAELAGAPWGEALTPAEQALLHAQARHWLGTGAADSAPMAAGAGTGDPALALSARELDVLARIAAGDSNKLIARALALSPHTVKRHVANILDKLDLASRGQAAAWYRQRPR